VSVTFEWRSIALADVLLVRVEPSPTLTSLIQGGDMFRRVGATNRKLRPGDVIVDARVEPDFL
jgi:hypothetical protein